MDTQFNEIKISLQKSGVNDNIINNTLEWLKETDIQNLINSDYSVIKEILIRTTYTELDSELVVKLWDLVSELPEKLQDSSNEEKSLEVINFLLVLIVDVMNYNRDKISEQARVGALNTLKAVIIYYNIPDSLSIFRKSLKYKNSLEQISAMEGIGQFYSENEQSIPENLVSQINDIVKKAKNEEILQVSLQVLQNAGAVDSFQAQVIMDDWRISNEM